MKFIWISFYKAFNGTSTKGFILSVSISCKSHWEESIFIHAAIGRKYPFPFNISAGCLLGEFSTALSGNGYTVPPLWLHCHLCYFLITESQYHSKIQIRKNLRRSLVHPPAPGSVRDQTRLVGAVSSLFLKPSKGGERTSSLSILSYLVTFHGRRGIQKMSGIFFHISYFSKD